ncbi:MAG: DMT family transporter [Paracoccaceae bacterium]|jgi:drug/metabolite transporter (DMT)-like permease|nr:DMT family transporter [Paracoccaceae bacterium]
MNDRSKGLLITLIGVVFVIPDSIMVRLISSDPMVTAFWRSLTAGIFVAIFVLLTMRDKVMNTITQMGRAGWMYCVLIGTTSPAFVLAVLNTSVANVVLIFASMPIFSALLSFLILSERPSRRLLLTSSFVFVGLAIIGLGSSGGADANWIGDLWAVYIVIAFSLALTLLRRQKHISMLPAIPIGYIGAAFAMFWFIDPLETIATDGALYVMHGVLIAASTCGLTLGPRYISATEVSLLILLESVFAPVLAWLVLSEIPAHSTILGGVLILSALVVYNIILIRQRI